MTIQVGEVAMVQTDNIKIGDRAREVLGDLDSLEGNLKKSGLIQPLAVKDNGDKTYTLLAGERRLTILKKNKVPVVPVRIYPPNISDLEMKVIEKAENFYRKDMEWWEFDRLTAEIHEMQQAQHGAKPAGPSSQGWGTKETAEMLNFKSSTSVTEAIKRAKAREAFPELFEGCKTAHDASKVLKKVDEEIVKQTIAEKLESQKSNSSLSQLSKCFIVRNFFEGVKEIPDGCMHLVEVDPPYAIDLTKKKKKDGESKYSLQDYNEVDKNNYLNGNAETGWLGVNTLLKECYRVMSTHSWLIFWFAPEPWFEDIYLAIRSAGFGTTRLCNIWTKSAPGQNMNPQIRLSNSYEMFFYAWKGQPALNKAGRGNEFRFSPVPASQKVHPTERPIDLMVEIYDTFAFGGSRVFIPFLGSGNGILAAHHLGMNPIGFDLAKSYKDSFLVRVHKMQKQIVQ